MSQADIYIQGLIFTLGTVWSGQAAAIPARLNFLVGLADNIREIKTYIYLSELPNQREKVIP